MPSRSPSADRKRRYRQRQRDGVRVYPVTVPDKVVEIAINLGHLTEAESHDRAKVGEAVARVVTEWANQWSDYFGTRPA